MERSSGSYFGELGYLELVADVMHANQARNDRTGVGTLSLFGKMLKFDLEEGFPLLTTKKMFFTGVREELLWILRGCTDAKVLSAKGVSIWDANGSREFLDNLGFTNRREGDLGPVYGFQMRHSGAEYKTCDDDYTGQGVDQIANLIDGLKKNPTSRRHFVSLWNPSDLHLMVLPPCHLAFQFYVDNDGRLSCCMNQRSCDLGLGIPFNIASYALLTHLVAHVCGYKVGELTMFLGDVHVYSNHVDALFEQITRDPKEMPKLVIDAKDISIDEFTAEHIHLVGYKSHPAIKMEMAV